MFRVFIPSAGTLASLVHVILLAVLSMSLPTRAVSQSAPPPQLPRVTLEEVGVRTSFGLQEQDRFLAVLHRPLDAAFMGDQVAVLDGAAPWVRIFDAQGRFVRAMIGSGENPGETLRPFAISSTPNGQVLLAHHRGLERISIADTLAASLPLLVPGVPTIQQPFRVLGAIEACGGGDLVLLLENRRTTPPSTAVVRTRPDGQIADTLATFPVTRRESRTSHPWFVDAREGGLTFYTEENHLDRIVEVGCDGQTQREIPLDSVGEGMLVTRMVRDGMNLTGIRSALGPFPAGLVRVGERVLWAKRLTAPRSGGGLDSLTVVTSYDAAGRGRRIAIHGWFQLFDSRADGSLLVGNSWEYGQRWEIGESWGASAAVFRVDGNHLVELIDQRGVPLGPLVPD